MAAGIPGAPLVPSLPGSPGKPISPMSPLSPLGPGKPRGPTGPGRPREPMGPKIPYSIIILVGIQAIKFSIEVPVVLSALYLQENHLYLVGLALPSLQIDRALL